MIPARQTSRQAHLLLRRMMRLFSPWWLAAVTGENTPKREDARSPKTGPQWCRCSTGIRFPPRQQQRTKTTTHHSTARPEGHCEGWRRWAGQESLVCGRRRETLGPERRWWCAHNRVYTIDRPHCASQRKARPDTQAVNTLPVDGGGDVPSLHTAQPGPNHIQLALLFGCNDRQKDSLMQLLPNLILSYYTRGQPPQQGIMLRGWQNLL